MSLSPICLSRCLLVTFLAVTTSLAFGEKKTHHIDGIVSITLPQEWEAKPVEPMVRVNPTRISSVRVFGLTKTGAMPVMVSCIIDDLPTHVLSATKLEEVALANTKTMASRIKRSMPKGVEVEVGKLTMKKVKFHGKDRTLYSQEIREKGRDPILLSGVVWKTDSRTYCLQTVIFNPDAQMKFWTKFLEHWKDLTQTDRLYAESYQNHEKFLTAEQKERLPKVLKDEAIGDTVLKLMEEDLARKETYNHKLKIANARKMRIIYHRLLTDEQKKKFDQSIKRRSRE